MTDLVTHVLFAYVELTVLAWRFNWIRRRMVPIGMAGAVLPDLSKIHVVVSSNSVERLIGIPFSWHPFHRVGGLVAVAGCLAVFFERSERWPSFGFLVAGGLSHLFLDVLIKRANGLAPPYLYPVSWWRPPAGNLYLSSDLWPAGVAVASVLALQIWMVYES